MKTDYPLSGLVDIRVEPGKAENFALRLRVPEWSEQTSLSVNGAAVAGVQAGTWAVIERLWKPGDRVWLNLDLRPRILTAADGGKRYAAVVRGPVALARDLRLGGSIDEPVSLGGGDLDPVAAPASIEMAFAASGGKVVLCDYASAGNTWDARSRYRVWMPAV